MSLVGSRLGKYDMQAEIGRGHIGVVYRGFDPDVARTVAVKVLAPHVALEGDAVDRFLGAARAASRLNHPNIVTIYDMGEHEGWFYVVMEYVEGRPLQRLLAEQRSLPAETALSLLDQMTAALDYAHAQGLVHGGVKPSNVIIDGQGRVKLSDFGLVPLAPSARPSDAWSMAAAPQYASPEQASGKKADVASDLYSLAVIAYEMLAGAPPFDGSSASKVLQQQIHDPPPRITLERPDLPPAVDEVFSRALAKQPQRRYWSGTTFMTALNEALESQPGLPAVASATPGRYLQPSPQRAGSFPWGGFTAAGILMATVLVGLLAITILTSRPNPTATPGIGVTTTAGPFESTPTHNYTPVIATNTPSPEPTEPPTVTPSVMLSDEPGSILTVKVPVADVRAQPDTSSELVTQVIMGEKVMIREKQDAWYKISAIDQPSPKDGDGYPGWVRADALSLQLYESERIAIVMVPSAAVRTSPAAEGAALYHLSVDSRLAVNSTRDAWVEITLPDGQVGWLAGEHVRLVCVEAKCPESFTGQPDTPRPAEEVVATALQFVGTRYLWGGTSATAFDCSGFVYRVLHANGITVPRDSRPMSQSGTWVEKDDLRPGDIVFTASGGPVGQVSHCALYVGDGKMITPVETEPISVVLLDQGRYRETYWGARRYP